MYRIIAVVAFVAFSVLPVRADQSGGVVLSADNERAVKRDYEALHQHPELGKEETWTAKYIRTELDAIGHLTFITIPSLPTAVVALLDAARPGPTIALRAEMDARKGTESTGLPYASKVPGMMHSCGHDAHTAILLAAARELVARRDRLRGRVVFLFQPAEETAGGADDIVADGLLGRLQIAAMFALHSAPGVPVGTMQVSPGPVLAGARYFTVHVRGRQSHAAAPYEGDDVLLAAAGILERVSRLPARSLDLLERPAVVSVTSFRAGEEKSANVLPSEATFSGTVRAFDMDPVLAVLSREVQRAGAGAGVAASIDVRPGPPPTNNDAALVRRTVQKLAVALSDLAWESQPRGFFAEDFAYYTPERPCMYLSLGVAKASLGNDPVHTDRFSVHPDALAVGARVMTALALVSLAQE